MDTRLTFITLHLVFCLPYVFCIDEFGFSGQSPLELKVLSGERSLESFILEMSFKSYTTDGLLIVHRSTSSSDFYTVSVHNMTLAFWLQSSNKLLKTESIHPLNYDEWNNITLVKTNRLISLSLNDCPVIESETQLSGRTEYLIELGEILYLGGHHTPSQLTGLSPTTQEFTGCVRELKFTAQISTLKNLCFWCSFTKSVEYRLSQDTVTVDQLRRGLIKNCDTTRLCQYSLTVNNIQPIVANLCHWAESDISMATNVTSNCSGLLISYDWSLHYLYGSYVTISDGSRHTLPDTTPLNRSVLSLTVGADHSKDLVNGVYGVRLTLVVTSDTDKARLIQQGYFMIGCPDVENAGSDFNCEWLNEILTRDLHLAIGIQTTIHCRNTEPVTTIGHLQKTTEFWNLEEQAKNISAHTKKLTIYQPPLQIQCLSGCGDKVNPGENLTVLSMCRSCVTHSWAVYGCGSLCDTEVKVADRPQNESVFSFHVNNSFVNQQVVYIGTYPTGRNVRAVYNLTLNEPPILGNCSITPQSGRTLLTSFNVSCQGFFDPDSPLTYTLYQIQSTGKKTKLMKSDEAFIPALYLSEGPTENNHTLSLVVVCKDSMGLESLALPLSVTVLPLASGSNIVDVISGNVLGNSSSTGIISDLLAAGQQSAVTQILQTSVLALNTDAATNESNTDRKQQRTEVREAVVAILANSSTSSPDIEMVTSILNTATEIQEELSPQIQEQATVLYEGMTSAFSNKSANVSQSAAEKTAGLLLEGVTMLLDTRTSYGTKILHMGPPNDTLQKEVKSSAERLLGIVDKITDIMMDYITPDAAPSVFTTSKMNLALSKASPSQLGGKKLSLDRGNNSGDFTIPSDGKLSTLLSNTSFTSIQVMLTEKNPYIWDPASDSLTTPMVSLTLRDDLDQKLNVTSLTNPVDVYISNFNPVIQKSEENFTLSVQDFDSFNATQTTELCRIMTFNSTEGRSTVFTVRPLTFNLTVNVIEVQNRTNMSHLNVRAAGVSLSKLNNFTHIFSSFPTGEVSVAFCIDQTVDNYLELSRQCLTLTSCGLTLETQLYFAVCMYWNVTEDKWSSSGCQVGQQTTPASMHCQCTHLTAFSGSFLVAPNFVDPFADAALFLTFFSNPVVVSCVILIWLIYFTVDLGQKTGQTGQVQGQWSDINRGGVIIAHENNPDHKYAYLVCVITGWWKNAGTTSSVSLSFAGTEGHSGRHCLSESVPGRQCFLSGYEDWFLVTTSHSLGDLRSLSVWHDSSGKSPHWYLSRILIEDLQTQQTWTFLFSDWVAVDRGSVSLKVTLQPCSLEDLKSQTNQQFLFKSSRDLRESHLWLSIASKPSYSSFTRAQRLSCALCLLLMTMLTSLMFHGIPTDDPADQARVSYITISLSDLVIGVQSGLIMFPVNILIIQLFLKAKKKPRGTTPVRVKKKRKKQKKNSVSGIEAGEGSETLEEEEEEEREPAKEDGILPWWTVYIAWTLVISLSVVSSYFVMLYGLKYGYQKSVDWLVSFFTAFFQSAFITQPFKVIAISLVFTMILKKPVVVQGGKASTEKMSEQFDSADKPQSRYVPDPLSRRLMNRIRKKLKLEEEIHVTLRDIALYALFVICILFMAHGHRNVGKSLMMRRYMESVFIEPRHPPIYSQASGFSTDILVLNNIANVELFWSYIKERIVPVLGEMSLGNATAPGLVSEYFLLGKYRIRQVRIQEDSCDYPEWVRRKTMTFSMNCSGEYWIGNEDSGDYNMSWREPLTYKPKRLSDTWSHRSSWSLKTIPYEGTLATYSGGGYTVLLDGNVSQSLSMIQDLQDSSWIDHRTRAVFVEFTTYNANIKLFCVVMIPFEFSNLGVIYPSYQIFSTKNFTYSSPLEVFTALCEILFVIFALAFFYFEIKRFYYGGRAKYFSDPWSYVEIIQIIMSFSIVGLYLKKIVSVSAKLTDLHITEEFVSFYTSIFWDMTLNYILAFFVALVILKFFKYLKFNVRMYFMSQTLSIAKKNLLGFSLMVVIIVVAFAHFAVFTFGPIVKGFSNMGQSLITLFQLALGESDFYPIQQANRYMGPAFFFLYIFLVQWTVLVMFMAILNLAIEETKSNMAQMKNDLEVVDYIYNRIHQILPKCH